MENLKKSIQTLLPQGTRPLAIRPALYRSPLHFGPGKSGKFEVRSYALNDEVNIIGARQAWMRGIRPVRARLNTPITVLELSEEGRGVWMTDLPEELFQIAEMLSTVAPKGRVFVGGLGLGVLTCTLAQRPGVTSITVVERSMDVINLCYPRAEGGMVAPRVICADVRDALQNLPRHDYYLLDTWQGTSEATWWGEVMPLRRIIRQRFGPRPRIHCWAEDIMAGQIMRALVSTQESHWYYKGLPLPMGRREAKAFMSQVGTKPWEERYGKIVDANIRRQNG